MKRLLILAATAVAMVAAAGASSARPEAETLDIYFVDVEGGKATLVIAPTGESMLLDAGFAGEEGRFDSKPGDPARARDAQRILLAARDAGLARIDHVLVSHYHADHFGGVMELAELIPIVEYIDHAAPSEAAEVRVPGTLALYQQYVTLRSAARHRPAAAGDHFRMGDVEVDVVASDARVIPKALPCGGEANRACSGEGVPAQEVTENPNSTAVKLSFGEFSYLDVGDLSGRPLHELTCPINLLGQVDAYSIAHHGGADGSDPAIFAATRPRVAMFSNAGRKGAQAETFNTLRRFNVDGWQLHRTSNPGAENMPDIQIANLDTSTSAWIKLSASRDGSFKVANGRTGESISYPRR